MPKGRGAESIAIGGGRILFNNGGHNGQVGDGLLDMGNIPTLSIEKALAQIEHFSFNANSRSRQRDLSIITDISIDLNFAVDELFSDIWNILLFGDGTTEEVQTAGSVSDEAVTTPAKLDRSIFTAKTDISNVVITGVGETPTYVLGTDYEIVNATTGQIRILSGGTITASLAILIDYDNGARTRNKIKPASDPSLKGSARLEFTAQNGDDMTWIIQNCEVKSDGSVPLSSTEPSEISVVLSVLTDKTVTPAEPFGEVLVG